MGRFVTTLEQSHAINLSTMNQYTKMIAYAGAGKTSTIVLIAEQLVSQKKRGIYLAFNKAISDEAGRKLPRGVDAKTFHSLAFQNVDRDITRKLEYKFPGFFRQQYEKMAGFPASINITGDASKIQSNGSDKSSFKLTTYKQYEIVKKTLDNFFRSDDLIPSQQQLEETIDKVCQMVVYDDYKETIVQILMPIINNLWADYIDPDGSFRISHDVYLKIYALSNPIINYDFILFDEAQDSDNLMLSILKQQKCQIVFVGDPYQQIYEWRGAVDAMKKFEGAETYLTKSFRFGNRIAIPANFLLNYLKAPQPLQGNELKKGEIDFKDNLPVTDAILCRTNAGAISMALDYVGKYPTKKTALLNVNIAEIEELLKDLEDFNKDCATGSHHPILKNFENYSELEVYCKNFPGDTNIAPTFRLYDKFGYSFLIDNLESFKNINPEHAETIVTTAHRAKGQEWNRVLLGDDFEGITYKPATKDKSPGLCSDGEARLLYVTVTRAKEILQLGRIDDGFLRWLATHVFENDIEEA